ncbi:hypothetical protein [Mycetohabitans rhizoxinica]|uniref:hypothetical protein n=1 Tax=Mycetohabitans rhizoxinica TaxID=412963 RepID=UPI0030CF2F5D
MPNDLHRRAWPHFDLLHSSTVVATINSSGIRQASLLYGAIIAAIARIRLRTAHSGHQRLPRAEQQAASLQETVPSMEALTTPVKQNTQNAQNVQQVSPQATNASEVAHEASAVVS